jgi:dihydroorotate dehydrogenase (NAD+) catalytic subunit
MITSPYNGMIIKSFCISTALGHFGSGMFPYSFSPSYRKLISAAKETCTAIFSKSATRYERIGNFITSNPRTWKFVQRITGSQTGMLNAYGLTNPGVQVIAEKIERSMHIKRLVVYPNFFPEFFKGKEVAIKETLEAIEIYRRELGYLFGILEINYSCPNSGEEIRANMENCSESTKAIKSRHPDLFLITKIGYDHPYEFAQEQERVGADAIHAINTIPFKTVFPNGISPLEKYGKGGGGVSGGPAKMRAYEYNKGLRDKVSVPLIFGCGVERLDDYYRYVDAGADAVSACSLIIRDPKEAIRIIEKVNS